MCELRSRSISVVSYWDHPTSADAGRVRHAVGSGGVVVLQSTVQSTDAEVNLTTKRFTQLDQLLDQVHRLSPLLR